MVCLQCESPLCKDACPTGAIVENDSGNLTVNSEICIGCYNCVTACVYGGITVDPRTMKVVKCDLCNGDPACVKACEYEAISVKPSGTEGASERFSGFKLISKHYGLEQEGA